MERVAGLALDSQAHDRLNELLRPGAITMAFQPIIQLTGGEIVGYEALARFDSDWPLRTEEWFELAWRLGEGPALELACWRATAAAGAPPKDRMLFVNCRADTLVHPLAAGARAELGANVVLELSEANEITDYRALRAVLDHWTSEGDRVAIDDTGAGYAGLRHVVHLQPDFVKLDRSLIKDIDKDRNERAMVCALLAYAEESGAAVIAEGIERAEELVVLRELGVHFGQGFLLSRPAEPWPTTVWAPRLAVATGHDRRASQLPNALAAIDSVIDACDATASFLARSGEVMPSVYLERHGVLRCVAHRGLWQILDGMPPTAGITGRAFREGKTIFVPDTAVDDEYLEAIPGVRAEACAPIRVAGTVVGSLNIESYEPLPRRTIVELERACAMLGDRLRALGIEAPRSRGGRVARLATELAGLTDEDELRRRVCSSVCDLAGMNSSLLSITLEGGTPASTSTGPLADVLDGLDDDQHRALGELVASVASCYTAGDTTGACFHIAQSLRTAGARSVVVLPLDTRGRRIGFVLVAHTMPLRLVTDEIEALELLATQSALCLETARLVSEYRVQATTDSLTGLGNHAAFRSALDDRCAAEDGSAGALLLADIDNFKSVNDRFGHLRGDEVLRKVSDAMRIAVRPDDRLFRIGGDEFALLVAGASNEDISEIGRRVRTAAEEHLAPHGAGLSIGACVIEGGDADSIIERADKKLYEAKRGGGGLLLAG